MGLTRSRKTASGYVLVLTLLLAGCLPDKRPSQIFRSSTVYPTLVQTISEEAFYFRGIDKEYVTAQSVSFTDYFGNLDQTNIHQIILIPQSDWHKQEMSRRMVGTIEATKFRKPVYLGMIDRQQGLYAFKMQVTRLGLSTDLCNVHFGSGQSGCAVAANRALILADPAELLRGRRLANPLGVFEEKTVLDAKMDKVRPLGSQNMSVNDQ
ncbi:hypothetical protein [Sneathiella aquimaris]|uniref:hypothetical protein n=1 Tax=Sneathiella aquimaris TaxID=2599305 RepID=UPI00146C42D8|nr:hypothetical protein [Sneathiella aquimaris]